MLATPVLRWLGLTSVAAALLLLVTLALPVRRWRTGEQPTVPLRVVVGGPEVDLPQRVWIDTDAACGVGRATDPDDCLAILLLARSPAIQLVGISSTYGNAAGGVTDSIARDLARLLHAEGVTVEVYRGAAGPLGSDPRAWTPAQQALARALSEGGGPRLTILGLGPLTNVELTLRHEPALARRIGRLVAVMGRRRGHVFHPSEGHGAGAMLFGHGPVFRDLNLEEDPAAAAAVLARRIPITLVPYDVAREVRLDGQDLGRLAGAGAAGAWVAQRVEPWLEFWRKDVGLEGFYPFDAVAAVYVESPELFSCAPVRAEVGEDSQLGWIGRLLGRSTGLLVAPGGAATDASLLYCPTAADSALHRRMVERLVGRRE